MKDPRTVCGAMKRCDPNARHKGSRFRAIFALGLVMALFGPGRSPAAAPPSDLPSWLEAHIGEGRGQIARVVLERARALYLKELNAGTVKNPCYFAMDATRPNDPGAGRFYVICEKEQSFRAIAAGHGRGRHPAGVPNFENGRQCARNFGNAL